MREQLNPRSLPDGAVLVTCSSHEDRCTGLLTRVPGWNPGEALLFHYDDPNPIREKNHQHMMTMLRDRASGLTVLEFTEADAVSSLRRNVAHLRRATEGTTCRAVVIDVSVFTKRHLLMMLRWLDDQGFWDKLYITYSEPGDYVVSEYVPLSFGLKSLRQAPGFSACPDLSRPVHLVMFLGYEGDRALAVYEQIQPMRTTLVIADPPYRPEWAGRTERFNRDLLVLAGEAAVLKVDAIDPEATSATLADALDKAERSEFARIICPLGTKPQTVGVYNYLRNVDDSPAVVYAGPLRHNHSYYSTGLGETWMLKVADRP